MLTGTLDGTTDAGACGPIPVVQIDAPKPRLRNNGYACYCGHPLVKIEGLRDALPAPDDGRIIRRGYVVLRYRDGLQFFTYASTVRGDDTYSFC